MIDNIHWSVDIVNTKQRNVNFIIGERGVGKTYTTLKYCIKRALRYGEEFFYMRRLLSELDTVKDLFDPLILNNEFPGVIFSVKGNDFYADGKVIGHWGSLSTSNKFKGTAYPLVKYLIYDEFLAEKGATKELKKEVHKFYNMLETLFRNRDFKVYLLANATTFECCYKYEMGLKLPYGDNEFWYHPKKSILVQLVKNEPYREAKMASPLGKLIEDTSYAEYAVFNNFYMDSYAFVKKRSGTHYQILSFSYRGRNYGLYISRFEKNMVIDYSCRKLPDYQIKDIDMTEEGIRLLSKSSHPVFRYMRAYQDTGHLNYQSMEIKTQLYELLFKIL